MNEVPFRITGTRLNPKVGSEEDIDISLDGGPAKPTIELPQGSLWYLTDFICTGTKAASFKVQVDDEKGTYSDCAFIRVGADGTVSKSLNTAIFIKATFKRTLRVRVQGDFDNTRVTVAIYGYTITAESVV